MFNNNGTEIAIDYITGRIDILTKVNKEVHKRLGYNDPEVSAKIQELEDVRSFLSMNLL
ncbi:hypothetical protein MKY95_18825 [Paenibacillus sp. FSL P4-0176]|uniref:hypothetical protein n=1 Tax=Paenibacillus sp. FSL P4-0176 TaxID=2921631 RepID=UPI0030CF63BA